MDMETPVGPVMWDIPAEVSAFFTPFNQTCGASVSQGCHSNRLGVIQLPPVSSGSSSAAPRPAETYTQVQGWSMGLV